MPFAQVQEGPKVKFHYQCLINDVFHPAVWVFAPEMASGELRKVTDAA